MRKAKKAIDSFIFPFDSVTSKMHALVFIRHRCLSMAAAAALYAAVMLATGDALGVSSNYFVVLPVVTAALCFGTAGGVVAGILGLPSNLLIFQILGHPDFSPASKAIAELSGLFIGFLFGRLADYFRVVEREIKKRMATEEALRAALEEKGLLLRELNHRVKNNLNVMKSLVQLQRNRSSEPAFLEASDQLIARIFAISLVHDQLDRDQDIDAMDPAHYIEALVGNLASGFGLGRARIGLDLETEGLLLPVDAAVSLGLVINEVLMNAIKHASLGSEGQPSIRLAFKAVDGEYRLEISDDGPGPGGEDPREDSGGGLGLKLVRALAKNLGGTASLNAIEGPEGPVGARFELVFPA